MLRNMFCMKIVRTALKKASTILRRFIVLGIPRFFYCSVITIARAMAAKGCEGKIEIEQVSKFVSLMV